MLYGSELQTINKLVRNYLKTAETFHIRMMRIPKTNRHNEEILRINTKTCLPATGKGN